MGRTGLVDDVAESHRAQGDQTRTRIYCRRVVDVKAAAKACGWGVLLQPQVLEHFLQHAQTDIACNAHAAAWKKAYGDHTWLNLR